MAKVGHITGLIDFEKALDELIEPKFRQQALAAAGRAAMKSVLPDIKAAAPVMQNPEKHPNGKPAGELKNSIKLRVSTSVAPKISKGGKVTKATLKEMSATIRTGKAAKDYAVVTEFGRRSFEITKYSAFGKATMPYKAILASIEARPWMRPTFAAHENSVLNIFISELGKAITKKAKSQKRLVKKRNK